MFFISKRHDDFHVNFLKYMCACGQVFAGFNVEVVRGQLDELITKTSKHEDALPPSAGTTTRTGQSGGDQARPGVPVFDITLLSGMVKSSVISAITAGICRRRIALSIPHRSWCPLLGSPFWKAALPPPWSTKFCGTHRARQELRMWNRATLLP